MRVYALVKNGPSKTAFNLQERPTPAPRAHEVLIESEGFGLNFADIMARLGMYKDCPPLPAVIGYENVGRIKEVGAEVKGFKVGERVLAFTRFGGYADHVVAPELAVVKIPDVMELGEATALATQYVTAYFAVEEATRVHAGDRVLIHAAAGGVGTALVQILKAKGCIIFGTAGSSEKLTYLKHQGVHYPINYRAGDYAAKIEKLGFKGKMDVTYNPIGGDYVKKDYTLLNSGGRVVIYGASKLTETNKNIFKMLGVLFGFGFWSPVKLVSASTSLIGINMLKIADNRPDLFKKSLDGVISLFQSGKIKPQVGGEFPHTQLADAHDFLASRNSIGKVAIKW